MKTQDFCYWLQGYCELNGGPPNSFQWDMIKEHLALVFKKETSLSVANLEESEREKIIKNLTEATGHPNLFKLSGHALEINRPLNLISGDAENYLNLIEHTC